MRVLASPASTGPNGNPYIEQLTAGLRRRGLQVDEFTRRGLLERYPVVHLHWPELLIDWERPATAVKQVASTLSLLAVARRRGSRLIWTAHNLASHDRDRAGLRRAFGLAVTALLTDVVSLSAAGVPLLRARYPALRRIPVHVVPHGDYRAAYPAAPAQASARQELGVPGEGPLVLQFGQLRRYKGIEATIEAFRPLGAQGARMLVAGRPHDTRYAADLARLAATVPGVSLRPERIPQQLVPTYLAACDVVSAAYPLGTALNSGVALLALSFDRPVVVRDTPVMRELGADVGPGWVHRAAVGAETEAMQSALAAAARLADSRPDLSRFQWDRIVEQTLDIYRGR